MVLSRGSGEIRSYYFALRPKAETRFNYYLNLKNRAKNGRNVYLNSGNYLTAGLACERDAGLVAKSSDWVLGAPINSLTLPVGFGMQRSFKSGLYYNVVIGASYNFTV